MDALCGANTKSGTLTLGDKNFKFPLYEGTVGPEVLDISKLYNQAGIFTYDPGFTSTGSCDSRITYIDGDEGVLLYRGYPIEELAEHGDFLETSYLLLYGELPTARQKAMNSSVPKAFVSMTSPHAEFTVAGRLSRGPIPLRQ